MSELIHEYSFVFRDEDGTPYRVRAWGDPRADGTWEGWLEFKPDVPLLLRRRTGRETTQPNRQALAYWAGGLEPVYFEGAFARAYSTYRVPHLPAFPARKTR